MNLARRTPPPLPSTRGVAVAVVLAMGGSALYLGHRAGIATGLLVLAGEAAALVLMGSAYLSLAAFIVLGVVAEDDPTWGINLTAAYNHGTGQPSPLEALELLAVAAALLYLASTRLEPRFPRPFGPALLLTVVALVGGVATGMTAGASRSALLGTPESTLPLVIVPMLMVNVLRTRKEFYGALWLGAALAAFKALAGLFVYFSGLAAVQGSFGRITYFQPPANLLLMLFLLYMLAAVMSHIQLPRWTYWAVPLVLLTLVLSFRRTIWLGTAVGVLLILFPASGRVGRRVIVPGVAVIAVVGYLILSTGLGGGLQGPLVTRATSISLSKVSQNQQDRYRIDERRNVWAAIKRSPVIGLGIGVSWPIRYPVGVAFQDQTDFSHIAVLFWWMKMGLIGLAAYIALIVTALATGFRVWRRHPDPRIRVFGLAAAGVTIGLAVVELATSVLGASERGSMLFGAIIGLLAVAYAQLDPQPEPISADTVVAP